MGHTNEEAAQLLHISRRTVETHRAAIMAKLNLSSRAELVRFAMENDLLS
jgi:two-component system response regulator NreC